MTSVVQYGYGNCGPSRVVVQCWVCRSAAALEWNARSYDGLFLNWLVAAYAILAISTDLGRTGAGAITSTVACMGRPTILAICGGNGAADYDRSRRPGAGGLDDLCAGCGADMAIDPSAANCRYGGDDDGVGTVAFVELDYLSRRASEARIGRSLNGVWGHVIVAAGWTLLIVGIALLVVGISIGWLIMGMAALCYMVAVWERHYLRELPRGVGDRLDDVVAGDVLGALPKDPRPVDIALAAATTTGGLFVARRLGITPMMVGQLANTVTHPEAVWDRAREIARMLDTPLITGEVLVVALIQAVPDHERIIASIHLSNDDLIEGIRWYRRIQTLIDAQKHPRRTGGIGRDWSFGYIPLLARFGHNISQQLMRGGLLTVNVASHQEAVERLIDIFQANGRQNAALIGPPGVGKTTLIHAFAERLLDAGSAMDDSLKFRQVVILDSSALIAAAPGRGELEQLIMRVLGEAFSAQNIIICLDNAELFFEEGIGAVDLTNVLGPILDAGRLRIIMSMDEQRFLRISQRNAALANSLNRIMVTPADEHETMQIMQEQILLTEMRQRVTYMYQSLQEAYRLSQRYIYDLAMPGQAMKLLESAAGYAENGVVTMNSVQQAIEKTMNVKVSVAQSADDRDRLLRLEDLIHERMINQTHAVAVVSDALRRARAGVRNQNRPIGTFLFLGPTGVGKTELAKALASVYFDGEDRLIRLDLNEFVTPNDVARLIADGATDPTSLAAQVMKQPFSVILLDEIEKAHPSVLATLLQVLDEGILRDSKGREIRVRDAIIIATSNAGADRIREYVARGYDLTAYQDTLVNELITSGQFKPEFLNRFDEIVLFRPLAKPELLQVIDLMIAGVNKTLEVQKVAVAVDDSARELLVDRGYDPQLGARPMRRVVQRSVENLVARAMLSGQLMPGSSLTVTRSDIEPLLTPSDAPRPLTEENHSDASLPA